MECKEYLERLAAFLERDFDPALARELAQHADACRGCEDARVDDPLVRRVRDCVGADAAPAELRERIVERIRPADRP